MSTFKEGFKQGVGQGAAGLVIGLGICVLAVSTELVVGAVRRRRLSHSAPEATDDLGEDEEFEELMAAKPKKKKKRVVQVTAAAATE